MTTSGTARDGGLALCAVRVDRDGDAPVIDALSLSLAPGTILGVVGPSGSGKTTILRAIAGLLPVTAGRILVGEADITHLPAQRRPTGLVSQSPTLFGSMTVEENIAFGLDDATMSEQRRRDRIDIAMATMNVSSLADRSPAGLSGGQAQRVSLARTLVRRPSVLLFDEPLAHVEVAMRHAIRTDIVAEVRRLGITTVYVTQDIDEACLMGDQLLVLREGRIAQLGTPQEVYHRPASAFVGRLMGVTNILDGRARADAGTTGGDSTAADGGSTSGSARGGQVVVELGQVTLTLPARADVECGPVTVFIPPEGIALTSADTPGEWSAHGFEQPAARAAAVLTGIPGQIIAAGFARSHLVYDVETELGTLVAHDAQTGCLRAPGDQVVIQVRRGWVIPSASADRRWSAEAPRTC